MEVLILDDLYSIFLAATSVPILPPACCSLLLHWNPSTTSPSNHSPGVLSGCRHL